MFHSRSGNSLMETYHKLFPIIELLFDFFTQVAVWHSKVLPGFSIVIHHGQEAIWDVNYLNIASCKEPEYSGASSQGRDFSLAKQKPVQPVKNLCILSQLLEREFRFDMWHTHLANKAS